MSSFFPFASSSTSVKTVTPAVSDDPHLEVTVTPSSSAFYAGETFAVTITLRNTRIPSDDARIPDTPDTVPPTAEVGTATSAFRGMPSLDPRTVEGYDLPPRKGQVGKIPSRTEAPKSPLPSRLAKLEGVDQNGYPYSPGANPLHRAGWPKDGDVVIRSPETWRRSYGMESGKGHGRRTRSWALGNKGMSPQEMVWALGGEASMSHDIRTCEVVTEMLSPSAITKQETSRCTSYPFLSPTFPQDLRHDTHLTTRRRITSDIPFGAPSHPGVLFEQKR